MVYPSFIDGQAATVSQLRSMQAILATKFGNELLSNSNILQDDDELALPVEANAGYLLSMQLFHDGSSTGDLVLQFSSPAGTTMRWGTLCLPMSLVTSPQSDGAMEVKTETTAVGIGVLSPMHALVSGRVLVGSTAGTLQLQWCQNVSDASPVYVLAGSWMRLERYA